MEGNAVVDGTELKEQIFLNKVQLVQAIILGLVQTGNELEL